MVVVSTFSLGGKAMRTEVKFGAKTDDLLYSNNCGTIQQYIQNVWFSSKPVLPVNRWGRLCRYMVWRYW